MLRGRRRLTSRSIQKFGARLGQNAQTIAAWIAREERQSRQVAEEATETVVRQLALDTANLIADWHHYAILELVHVRDFVPDSRWIARVLDISVDEVNVALQRLLRLGLLEMATAERWIDHLGDSNTSINGFAKTAIERFLYQVRQLTLNAMQAAPGGRYAFNSTTLAVNTARIPEAIELMARMKAELVALLRHDTNCDDVYQLELSLVPITQFQRKEMEHGTAGHTLANHHQGP